MTVASCNSDNNTGEPADNESESEPVAVDDALLNEAVQTYAAGVHSAYDTSLMSAHAMDAAIDAFLESPSQATLDSARHTWLVAREDYGPTEVFRFYGGPIDHEETGTEGMINAWPLDEAYIDYVEGSPNAGIINNPEDYPQITAGLLLQLNEQGGEANISTGWHAIEFLLWGQDLNQNGPGNRPVTDYTTAANSDRRSQYLEVVTDQLIIHLEELVNAWAPDKDNYRKTFESMGAREALQLAFTGIGEMSRGELAGERMNVAYTERSQEDEHSCFSDNTTADIVGNARGIEMVLLGSYPGGVSGVGLLDLVRVADSSLADQLRSEVAISVSLARAIPEPFDQHLQDDVSDQDPGRKAILATIEALENQTDTIVDAADVLGIMLNVS
ncbi:MAG: hypothetical protein OXI96_08220 [Acidimicrobiaceae bacterium]|nr:hypothetical protein [Acidimicrobiaceae bacterium]